MATNVDDRTGRSISARQAIRAGILVVLIALLALWAVANDNDVQVDWLVDTTAAPLVVVILVSAVIGFLVGQLARWRRH